MITKHRTVAYVVGAGAAALRVATAALAADRTRWPGTKVTGGRTA